MAVGWRSESPSSTGDFLWFSSRCYLAHTVLSHSLFSPELRMYKRGRGSGHLFITYPSFLLFAAAAKSLQSCPTLCNPTDGSPPGSPVPGILQARACAWKWKVKVKSLSRVRLLVTPWTAAYQAPPSMGFSRQEYWSGVPLPSPFYFLDV